MTDAEKQKLEALRQQGALKTMYYSRYFLVRYVVTFFLLVNVNWAVLLYTSKAYWSMLLPIVLIVVGFTAVWEQFKLYTVDQPEAKATKRFLKLTIAVNALMALLAVVGQQRLFYPFFKQGQQALLVILGIVGLGTLLALWMLHKISRIDQNIDKQYHRIKRYLASLKA